MKRKIKPDPKWIKSAADERAYKRGFRFDLKRAEHVRDFFRRYLRHSKGQWAGQPFELLRWQWAELVAPLFGWIDPATGHRRYRLAYIEVPKKNGKSTLCAGLALYLLSADGEPGAEVYSAAVDRDQASIVFREAASMVTASPELAAELEVIQSTRRIVCVPTNSIYRALSAEVSAHEGLNIHGLIFDELHAQATRKMWDTLRYGGRARRQPLSIAITTAGDDHETICGEQHEYAKGVIEGRVDDDRFFGLIYAAGEKDKWDDPKVWKRTNPSLGTIITLESLEQDAREARSSLAKRATFCRYSLNQWLSGSIAGFGAGKWESCSGLAAGESPMAWRRRMLTEMAGAAAFGGLDLSARVDMTAFLLLFRLLGTPARWRVLPWFWLPQERAEARRQAGQTTFMAWAEQGFLELIPGDEIDQSVIRDKILELAHVYPVADIGYDEWSALDLSRQLREDHGIPMTVVRQGRISLSEPSKELEAMVVGCRLEHGDNPILAWNARNLVFRTDNNANIWPDKKKSTGKIDGIVALITSLARALTIGTGGVSIYETPEPGSTDQQPAPMMPAPYIGSVYEVAIPTGAPA